MMLSRLVGVVVATTVAVVAGCAHIPPADPAVQAALGDIGASAGSFFAGLRGKTAPDCSFDANAAAYTALDGKAAALGQLVAAKPDDPPLRRAVAALGKTITGAEAAHRRASANAADINGVCLAPAVIDLNADAIARATAAIVELERKRGGNDAV